MEIIQWVSCCYARGEERNAVPMHGVSHLRYVRVIAAVLVQLYVVRSALPAMYLAG